MEDESRVFGQDAESSEDNKNENIKNIKISVSDHSDKEDITKTDADKAIEDFLSYVDGLVENEPEPSEEEVRSGIDKILAKVYPEKSRKKKVTVKKVLFLVALLSVLSVVSIYVMGDYHDISIENGFVTFAKDAIQITFFGESEEEYISVDTLLADLESHGYKDLMFPEAFLFDDGCKVSLPEYSTEKDMEQVSFYVYSNEDEFYFSVYRIAENYVANFPALDNAQTVISDGVYIHIFEHNSDHTTIEFIDSEFRYYISSSISYLKMVSIAETIE